MKFLAIFTFHCCLLDCGVTGVCMDGQSVSVPEGESLYLDTNVKVNQQQRIRWSFSDVHIAEITGDLSFNCTGVQCEGGDGKFRNRLKLDSQTGSLTIKDSKIADTGVYKLQINNESRQTEKIFIVTVIGFFHFGSHGEPVFVMKGDSVTLHSGVKTNQQDKIRWYFNNTRIAQITGDFTEICTDVQCNEGNERFRNRLMLDHQTGNLTIKNITNTHSGVFRLRIISNDSIREMIFIVAVFDIPGVEMKKKLVKEGESVTLEACLVNSQNYVTTLYFNDTLITEMTNKTCSGEQCVDVDKRFRGRLNLDHQTGSLTITDSRNTDSGDYKLLVNSSTFSLMKIFSVKVAGEYH
ncbi:uncharacterized protein LOC130216612 [Danio aesculapii]|uniref:uncharacterized protein LOC130216612 n=1 Tax=Danio aesculapii TaxID=1142201 RepID=UPI0024BF22DC|nr:uncharacterized protein LOC130216612 [Danio aesculapii]